MSSSSRNHAQTITGGQGNPALAIAMLGEIGRLATFDADFIGELLRKISFIGNGEVYGCYSTFELISSYQRIKTPIALAEYIAWDADEQGRIESFYSRELDLLVAWYWDGDGTLYFDSGLFDCAVWNNDCKKDYGWEYAKRFRKSRDGVGRDPRPTVADGDKSRGEPKDQDDA